MYKSRHKLQGKIIWRKR